MASTELDRVSQLLGSFSATDDFDERITLLDRFLCSVPVADLTPVLKEQLHRIDPYFQGRILTHLAESGHAEAASFATPLANSSEVDQQIDAAIVYLVLGRDEGYQVLERLAVAIPTDEEPEFLRANILDLIQRYGDDRGQKLARRLRSEQF